MHRFARMHARTCHDHDGVVDDAEADERRPALQRQQAQRAEGGAGLLFIGM